MARGCRGSIAEVSAVRMSLTEIVQAQGSISQGMWVFGTITETCTSEGSSPEPPPPAWATETTGNWRTETGDLWLLEA